MPKMKQRNESSPTSSLIFFINTLYFSFFFLTLGLRRALFFVFSYLLLTYSIVISYHTHTVFCKQLYFSLFLFVSNLRIDHPSFYSHLFLLTHIFLLPIRERNGKKRTSSRDNYLLSVNTLKNKFKQHTHQETWRKLENQAKSQSQKVKCFQENKMIPWNHLKLKLQNFFYKEKKILIRKL